MSGLFIEQFFDLQGFSHRSIFDRLAYPWHVLNELPNYVTQYLKKKNKEEIFLDSNSKMADSCICEGKILIGKNCLIGPYTYLRGPLIIGDNCRIGTTEIKNSILLNSVHAAHLNYIGDSIIGNQVNLGAGTKLANYRLDHQAIMIKYKGKHLKTNQSKFGSLLGDQSQTGANAVLNPGTILGKNCLVYPLVSVKAKFYPINSVINK